MKTHWQWRICTHTHFMLQSDNRFGYHVSEQAHQFWSLLVLMLWPGTTVWDGWSAVYSSGVCKILCTSSSNASCTPSRVLALSSNGYVEKRRIHKTIHVVVYLHDRSCDEILSLFQSVYFTANLTNKSLPIKNRTQQTSQNFDRWKTSSSVCNVATLI